jgi:SAM-dependent methyltransferase
LPGLSWLEPSAGLGRILRPILSTEPASVTACEVSAELSGELFREFPGVTLGQGDFLERLPAFEGGGGLIVKPFPGGPPFFDRIVMNPPFHMRADVRHIRHALKFLRPGGVLVGLCLATHHREAALRPLADVWETIPAGAFRSEGTGVETILFKITTHL